MDVAHAGSRARHTTKMTTRIKRMQRPTHALPSPCPLWKPPHGKRPGLCTTGGGLSARACASTAFARWNGTTRLVATSIEVMTTSRGMLAWCPWMGHTRLGTGHPRIGTVGSDILQVFVLLAMSWCGCIVVVWHQRCETC